MAIQELSDENTMAIQDLRHEMQQETSQAIQAQEQFMQTYNQQLTELNNKNAPRRCHAYTWSMKCTVNVPAPTQAQLAPVIRPVQNSSVIVNTRYYHDIPYKNAMPHGQPGSLRYRQSYTGLPPPFYVPGTLCVPSVSKTMLVSKEEPIYLNRPLHAFRLANTGHPSEVMDTSRRHQDIRPIMPHHTRYQMRHTPTLQITPVHSSHLNNLPKCILGMQLRLATTTCCNVYWGCSCT
jgi:hypothetical protein